MSESAIQRARASMTPEQIKEYERLGDDLYNTIDYASATVLADAPYSPIEGILEVIKSGMDPAYLTDEEQLIYNQYLASTYE